MYVCLFECASKWNYKVCNLIDIRPSKLLTLYLCLQQCIYRIDLHYQVPIPSKIYISSVNQRIFVFKCYTHTLMFQGYCLNKSLYIYVVQEKNIYNVCSVKNTMIDITDNNTFSSSPNSMIHYYNEIIFLYIFNVD